MKDIFVVVLCMSVITFSCVKKKGCTDIAAINYDSEAKKDDGSCIYIEVVDTTTTDTTTTDTAVTDTSITPAKVFAGKYDSTFVKNDFIPSFELTMTWDSLNLYGAGYDSLDIDLDGTYDVYLKMSLVNYDNGQLLSGYPNPFPNCKITSSGEYEFSLYPEYYPIGMRQYRFDDLVDRLDYNERIDTLSKWGLEKAMWQDNPGNPDNPASGDWKIASSIYYIAVRKSGTKYGWVEVDASNPENPKFVSCALQK
ncbi:MAG: hypothetical protein ACJAZ2_001163 [Glaciecola sp.]|jgi:hypothetical protein